MIGSCTIRRLTADDASDLRALRLEALERDPEAFGSSLAEERDLPIEHFGESTRRNVVLGLFAEDRLAGMAGFYVQAKAKTRHRGTIWGVYVRPGCRGTGLGRALVEAAIGEAKGLVEAVYVSVTVENRAARTLYIALGFQPFGLDRGALRVDGRDLDEEHMILRLEGHRPA